MESLIDFEKHYLEENIFYIENFISDQEINKILSFDYDWKSNRGDTHDNVLTSTLINNNQISYFIENVEKRIRSVVDNENQSLKSRLMMTKYIPKEKFCHPMCGCHGNALGFHYENHPECDYESRWITLGIVLYFNDDYEGGELVFEHKPIKIKPKKGALMVFPASEEYSHAVKEVHGSERIVYAAFVYGKQYWDILKRSGLM